MSRAVTRLEGILVVLVVVVAGVAAYAFAAQPAPQAPTVRTVTATVTAAPTTTTVTAPPVTSTVTASPITTTVTVQPASLYDAARREGKVVWYTAMVIPTIEAMKKAFEAKYPGITVEFIRLLGGPLTDRVQSEQLAGKVVEDVITGAYDQMTLFKEKGWLVPYYTNSLEGIHGRYVDPDFMLHTDRIVVVVLGYNTKLVKAEEAPKSWEEMVSPRWKGKIGMPDPVQFDTATVWFHVMKGVLKERWSNWVQDIRKLEPRFQVSFTPVAKQISTGEAHIGLTLTVSLVPEIVAGAPVAVAKFGPLSALLVSSAIPKGAQHPNAAKLFLDFFHTDAHKLLVDLNDVALTSRGLAPDMWKDIIPLVTQVMPALSVEETARLKKEMGLPWV